MRVRACVCLRERPASSSSTKVPPPPGSSGGYVQSLIMTLSHAGRAVGVGGGGVGGGGNEGVKSGRE